MVPEQIEREIVIAAPIEKVWAVLTEPDHIRVWFAFDGAEVDLRPGGAITFVWKEHGRHLGRIEHVDPPNLFSYRWSQQPDQQPRDGNSTLVEFTLNPEGSATRLRVVETGFRELDLPETDQVTAAKMNVEGWKGGFESLTAYIEQLIAA